MTDNQPNKTIYIRNIPYSTDGKQLAEAFQNFGEIIQSRVISGFYRGQSTSRGFGFIDFKTEEGYNNALNCKEPIKIQSDRGERELRVFPARPKVYHPKDTVYLGQLTENTKEPDIRNAFKDFSISEVRIPQARNPNQEKKYFAFVKFETEDVCKKAMELKTININGKNINILPARPKFTFPFLRRRGGYRRGGRGRRGYRGRGRGRRAYRQNSRQNNNQQQGQQNQNQQQGQQNPNGSNQ